MGIGVFVLWTANFLGSQLFPILTDAVGSSWTFVLFAILNVAALIFTLKKIPETKDHTLEALEIKFRKEFSRPGDHPAVPEDGEHAGIDPQEEPGSYRFSSGEH